MDPKKAAPQKVEKSPFYFGLKWQLWVRLNIAKHVGWFHDPKRARRQPLPGTVYTVKIHKGHLFQPKASAEHRSCFGPFPQQPSLGPM